MASLAELRERILDNLQRVAGDSTVQSANADRWVNHVIRHVFATRHNWDAMEATYSINMVADQELYPFPSSDTKDVKQVAMRLDSTSPYMVLHEESEDQLDGNIPLTSISGIPRAWARAGNALRFRPAPSVSTYGIRVRCWDYPVLLSGDGATNYWTSNHEDLVEDLATALGYRWLGDFERYSALWQLGMAELKERVENDAKRLRPSRQTVAPSSRAGRPASTAGTRIGEDGYYRQYTP